MRTWIVGVPAAVCMAAALFWQANRFPKPQDVRTSFLSSDRAILDRQGLIIDEIRVEKSVRRLDWIEIERVPPAFLTTLLRAEDRRFHSHPGFDPLALSKAVFERFSLRRERGASTITMQLVEILEPSARSRGHRRSVTQKLRQIWKALALEAVWSKSEILEAYLNLIHYRGELQGLSAASFGLLDKSPESLTRPDSAVLVSLIRAPNAKVDLVRSRACGLLSGLAASHECSLLSDEMLEPIQRGYRIRPYQRMAPHVARRLARHPDFSRSALIRSTLDRRIQWVATHALRKQIAAHRNQNMNDGAVVVLENSTGNVLAYVGNVGASSQAAYVDAAVAQRQAGSTLKPFIYAQAIEERLLTAATVLEDSPLAIAVTTGVYRPANFDRAFRDLVTVRSALASSLNIPAVHALEMVGTEPFVRTMANLGLTGLQRSEIYGPSLALGSADVRLIELTNAYRALANRGVWTPVRFSPDLPASNEKRRVFSEESAFIVTDILADRQARAATFGLESTLSTRFWTAVKTGTSKDMRDNWTIGFSEKYTVGVWAGNFSGESMWNVSGSQGAAPVWQELMNELHRGVTSRASNSPPGVLQAEVRFSHSSETRSEWFLKGTEPNVRTIVSTPEVRTRIAYPLDQSLIALDPDIPPSNQRVFIQLSAVKPSFVLYMNGRKLGAAKSFLPWEPRSGAHTLELRDAKGRRVDVVRFEVRGRGLRNVSVSFR